ncbi:MAG: DUF3177 family protein [Xenococcaceae cyanobacterium]
MDEIWFRPLVWTDYRLAVLFTAIMPLILLIWAFVRKSEAIQRLLIIYWRVASLLMITIYLMIPALSISFITGLSARILIPISLWFWVDLNDEIRDLPQSAFKLVLTSWRWAVTIYCSLGAIASLPFLSCAFPLWVVKTPFCKVWLEAPWGYKEIFHRDSTPGFLGFLGIVGLIFYLIYLSYFVLIRLGRQGRSALEQ